MFVTTSAIVINRIKFKDNDLILKLYTKEHGLLTFISKKSTNRGKNKLNSFFQPLTILQISFLNDKKKEMLYFKSVDLKYNFKSLHTDYKKISVTLFISEILTNVLKFQNKDIILYDFIERSMIYFDRSNSSINFHLYFLIQLTIFLGFSPANTQGKQKYFNLQEGLFTDEKPKNFFLHGDELEAFKFLLGTKFEDLHLLTVNSSQRNKMLDFMLKYYMFHIEGFRRLNSYEVLKRIHE